MERGYTKVIGFSAGPTDVQTQQREHKDMKGMIVILKILDTLHHSSYLWQLPDWSVPCPTEFLQKFLHT